MLACSNVSKEGREGGNEGVEYVVVVLLTAGEIERLNYMSKKIKMNAHKRIKRSRYNFPT